MATNPKQGSVEWSDEVIRKAIKLFKWYQPVDFGGGITTSNWVGSHTSASYEFGLLKWDYIVKRNLPDIQGKRVMDVGCNCGVFCVELSRAGAREVIGIDSEDTWPSWYQQATLVKDALEWRCQTTYNIRYVDTPMTEIPKLDLEPVDLVMFLCCIYYLSDAEIFDLLLYFRESGCPTVLLQGNTNKGDQLQEVYRRAGPRYLKDALLTAGYDHVTIDAPLFYSRPVVVGSTTPIVAPPQSKRDRLRSWIRRLV